MGRVIGLPRGMSSKYFVIQAFVCRRIEVAEIDERRVVRRVVQPEELLHVLDGRGGEIRHAADDRPGVRMARRVDRRADDLAGAAVGLVVHALPALVLHDVALRVELRHVERVEQEAHAVGFEPQRGARGSSTARSRSTSCDRSPWSPLFCPPTPSVSLSCRPYGTCPEPVNITCSNRCAKPVRPDFLVLRADVVHHVAPTTVGVAWSSREDDRQAVRQRVFLERDVERGRRRGLPGAGRERRQASGHARGDEQQAKRTEGADHEILLVNLGTRFRPRPVARGQ